MKKSCSWILVTIVIFLLIAIDTPDERTCTNEVVSQEVAKLEEKLADAVADKEELTQRCHELDVQMIN